MTNSGLPQENHGSNYPLKGISLSLEEYQILIKLSKTLGVTVEEAASWVITKVEVNSNRLEIKSVKADIEKEVKNRLAQQINAIAKMLDDLD